jgi:hypothetical protein
LTVKYRLLCAIPFARNTGLGVPPPETGLMNLIDGCLDPEGLTLTISNPNASAKSAVVLSIFRLTLSIIA